MVVEVFLRFLWTSFILLRINGCKQCSLSVQKDNFAAKWYGRLGFRVVKETEDEAIMLYRFA